MNFEHKSRLLKQLYTENACTSFVETGTYEGRMVDFICKDVKPSVVRSIELNETLTEQAIAKFSSKKHVKIIQGDSNTELANVLADPVVVSPLIWLDAHWSDGKTSRSLNGKDTPILEELQAIQESRKSCVVAIDDIRCFDGKNSYPTLVELYAFVYVLWPGIDITRVDDAVWFKVT
jgi:hypothetical protein